MASRLFRKFAPEVMIAFSLALVAVALAGVFLFEAESHVLDLLGWIDEHEFWGPCIFALVYMLVVIFVLPGLPLTLGAGFLFGIVRGSLFVIVAETLGATIAFLVARHLFGAGLSRLVTSRPRLGLVNEALSSEGWKIVLLTRMVPFFPFKLSNYFFGLSRYSLPGFVLGTVLGIIPNTVAIVYIGSLAADLATLDSHSGTRSNVEWAMYGVGLVFTLAAALYVTRLARRALGDGESDE